MGDIGPQWKNYNKSSIIYIFSASHVSLVQYQNYFNIV